jgi:hypothetical protein
MRSQDEQRLPGGPPSGGLSGWRLLRSTARDNGCGLRLQNKFFFSFFLFISRFGSLDWRIPTFFHQRICDSKQIMPYRGRCIHVLFLMSTPESDVLFFLKVYFLSNVPRHQTSVRHLAWWEPYIWYMCQDPWNVYMKQHPQLLCYSYGIASVCTSDTEHNIRSSYNIRIILSLLKRLLKKFLCYSYGIASVLFSD